MAEPVAAGVASGTQAFLLAIVVGTRQLAAGEYTEYDSQTLRERFDDLKSGKSFLANRNK